MVFLKLPHAKHIVASVLLLLVSGLVLAGSENKEFSVEGCLGCHGIPSYTNVYPTYHVPRLAGQHKAYLISALQAYKAGTRQHPTMMLQATTLSEKNMETITNYFSALPSAKNNPNPVIPEGVKAKAATCAACHTADGNSIVPTFPKIAGQREDYIYHSLKSYTNGQRKNPIMLGIVQTLTDDDMKALAKYYSQQPGLNDITLGITK